MLKVETLHTYYGNIHALKGVDFQVKKGEILALIGSNGAGKSTLLNTLAGVKTAKEGKIVFQNQDITATPALHRVKSGIILCPEGRQIFPKFTAGENLNMGAYTVRDKALVEETKAWVYELFPRLKEREKQPAGTLSGGEQQMLAIGRALMGNPRLLMLDEPSLGLAPILVEQIFSLIEEIRKKGVTVLLVEQNAMAALALADRAYVLETGSITLEGTGRELLGNERVIQSYLGG